MAQRQGIDFIFRVGEGWFGFAEAGRRDAACAGDDAGGI